MAGWPAAPTPPLRGERNPSMVSLNDREFLDADEELADGVVAEHAAWSRAKVLQIDELATFILVSSGRRPAGPRQRRC